MLSAERKKFAMCSGIFCRTGLFSVGCWLLLNSTSRGMGQPHPFSPWHAQTPLRVVCLWKWVYQPRTLSRGNGIWLCTEEEEQSSVAPLQSVNIMHCLMQLEQMNMQRSIVFTSITWDWSWLVYLLRAITEYPPPPIRIRQVLQRDF